MIKKKRGITLLEALVYLAIFAVFFLGVIQFAIFVLDYDRYAEVRNEAERSTIYLASHLEQTFDDVISIAEVDSVLSSDIGKLRLINTNGGYYEYDVDNDKVRFYDGNKYSYLSDDKFNVTKLRFEALSDDQDEISVVRITIAFIYEKDTKINREFTFINNFR